MNKNSVIIINNKNTRVDDNINNNNTQSKENRPVNKQKSASEGARSTV